MTRREWVAPGILIGLLTTGANFVAGYAVDHYKADTTTNALKDLKGEVAKQNDETGRRIDKVTDRLDQMATDGKETARLQEQVRTLENTIRDVGIKVDTEAMRSQHFREELYKQGILSDARRPAN